MLISAMIKLFADIEQLPLDKQESLAEVFEMDMKGHTTPPVTLEVLRAELDEDIAQGNIYDLDTLVN